MDWKFLKIETPEEGICILTISHPQSLNALSRPVLEEMYRFVTDIPEGTAVLIIRGDGPKSFVAGADISQMAGFDAEQGLDFGRFGAEVFRRIEELPIPVIAAVNGYALGGGCELAMACDIRIASEKAKFGQPEVKLGIIPGFSGTYRLPKLVGQGYAKEMIYSGRTIDAAEALRIGLVNHVLPPEELMDYVLGLARDIRANAPIAVRKAKTCINTCYDLDETTALAAENRAFSECFATEDQKTGMHAFLAKGKAEFKNR